MAVEWMEATCSEGARTAMQTREGAHTGGRAGVDNTYSQYVKPRAVSHRRAHRPQHPEVCSGDRPPASLGARGGSPADKKAVTELGSPIAMGIQDPEQRDQLVSSGREAGGCNGCKGFMARGPCSHREGPGAQHPTIGQRGLDSLPSKEVQDNGQRPQGSSPGKKWQAFVQVPDLSLQKCERINLCCLSILVHPLPPTHSQVPSCLSSRGVSAGSSG